MTRSRCLGPGLILALLATVALGDDGPIASPPTDTPMATADDSNEPVAGPLLSKPVTATRARPKYRGIPEYPSAMRSKGEEGWVTLSYVIGADGRVSDLIVQDSSGQRDFEKAALKAAAKWRFSPATVEGRPVEQCDTSDTFVFFIQGGRGGARKTFRDQFTAIRARYGAGDVEGAARDVDEMLAAGGWNNYETSRLRLLRFELCKGTGDLKCELENLRRAAFNRGRGLEAGLYRQVLEATAGAEIRSELYRDALQTIAKRNKLKPALAADHPLTKAAADIVALAHGNDPLAFKGQIGFRSGCDLGEPNWSHQLLRRKFAIDPLEGRVDKLEIRCDWRRATDSVSPDKAWTLPADWGNCVVYVFGEVGAKLKLVEYPATPAAAGNESLPAAVASD